MKIIIILIISIIAIFSICNAINIIPNKGIKGNQQWLNFLPYDKDCKKPLPGIGFGTLTAGTCMANYSIEYGSSISMTLDSTATYANLSSYGPTCGGTPDASQLFKIGQCGYYEPSNTNYYVTISSQPQVPKNTFVIMDNDQFCLNYIDYWFATPGLTIADVGNNQTNTYTCEGKIPYDTTCSGSNPPDCVKLRDYLTCEIFSGNYYDSFCTV
ncbi:hypothetical protein ACTFIU_006124 [Dictyostelium citrinum]